MRTRLAMILFRLVLISGILAAATLWQRSSFTLPSSREIVDLLLPDNDLWSLVDFLITVLAVVAVYVAVKKLVKHLKYTFNRSRYEAKDPKASQTPVERPISDVGEDALSRAPLVQSIADLLASPHSEDNSVIAIEGPWGSGKTSILRMVKSALASRQPTDLLVIEFDPWPEDSKRGVVSRLLDAIAAAIGSSNSLPPDSRAEAERLLMTLADSVAHDLGAGHGQVFRHALGWIDPVGFGSRLDAGASLQANRKRISESMAGFSRRLIVVVDDLDRVDQDELVAVLMAVNALAQLPRTSFLLAFDTDVVDSVLKARGLTGSQRSFREKIVHIGIPIPPPSFVDMVHLFKKFLQQFLTARDQEATWKYWDERIREEAIVMSVRLSETPRTLKRLANHTSLLLTRLRREVNAADVLLLELTRARFPPLWDFIRASRNNLDPHDTYSEGYVSSDVAMTMEKYSADQEKTPKRRSVNTLDRAVEKLRANDRNKGRQLMLVMFPQFFSKDFGGDERSVSVRQSRIEIGSNLRKYFSLGVEGMQIADTDVRTVIENPSFRKAILDQAAAGGYLDGMLSAVASHLDPERPPSDAFSLIDVVLNHVRDAWISRREDVSEAAAALLQKVIKSSPELNRPELLDTIARSTLSISTSHNLILDLLKYAELWRSGALVPRKPGQEVFFQNQLVPDEVLVSAKESWLNSAWSVGIGGLFQSEPKPMRILYRMGQLEGTSGSYSRVQQELWSFLKDDTNFLRFISEYSPSITGANYSVDGLEKLVKNWEEFIHRVRTTAEPSDAVGNLVEYEETNRPSASNRK